MTMTTTASVIPVHHCTGEPCNLCNPIYTLTPIGRTPHRCPVCDGRRTVPAGFYGREQVLSGTTPEACRSCDGTGILWG